MANRYCTDCGHSLAANDRFCAGCGQPAREVSQEAAGAETPASPEPPRESPETAARESERAEVRDPNIRAEDYGESPSRPSWWRWVFRGGS